MSIIIYVCYNHFQITELFVEHDSSYTEIWKGYILRLLE